MQHSVVRLTMDSPNISKTIWSTTTSRTPLQDSENSSKLSMHDTGNEKENSPVKPKLPDLLETSPNRSLTLTGPTTSLAEVLPIPSRRTTTPALLRARAQLVNRRSPPLPTFLQNSGKMESQLHRNISAILTKSFASFVAQLDTSPKTVQNPAQLLPKPKHPSLTRTSPCLPAQTCKKTEQSSRLCMT